MGGAKVLILLGVLAITIFVIYHNTASIDDMKFTNGYNFGNKEMDWRGASLGDDQIKNDDDIKKAALMIDVRDEAEDDEKLGLVNAVPLSDWVKQERVNRESEIGKVWINIEKALEIENKNTEKIQQIEAKLDLILKKLNLEDYVKENLVVHKTVDEFGDEIGIQNAQRDPVIEKVQEHD